MNDYFQHNEGIAGEQLVDVGDRAHYHNIGITGSGSYELRVRLKGGERWYSLGVVIDKAVSDAPFEFTGLLDELTIVPQQADPFDYELSGG